MMEFITMNPLCLDQFFSGPRPRRVLSEDGKKLLNLWYIPDFPEVLTMFKSLDDVVRVKIFVLVCTWDHAGNLLQQKTDQCLSSGQRLVTQTHLFLWQNVQTDITT